MYAIPTCRCHSLGDLPDFSGNTELEWVDVSHNRCTGRYMRVYGTSNRERTKRTKRIERMEKMERMGREHVTTVVARLQYCRLVKVCTLCWFTCMYHVTRKGVSVTSV